MNLLRGRFSAMPLLLYLMIDDASLLACLFKSPPRCSMIRTVGMFASYAEPTRNSIELLETNQRRLRKGYVCAFGASKDVV
jgi:hypothetical protein